MEESIVGIEDLVAKFGYELFEKTTSVDTFFDDSLLIEELDLKVVSKVELLLVNLIKGIFQDVLPPNRNWVEPLSKFLFLAFYDVLEDFGSQTEGYSVRHVD